MESKVFFVYPKPVGGLARTLQEATEYAKSLTEKDGVERRIVEHVLTVKRLCPVVVEEVR